MKVLQYEPSKMQIIQIQSAVMRFLRRVAGHKKLDVTEIKRIRKDLNNYNLNDIMDIINDLENHILRIEKEGLPRKILHYNTMRNGIEDAQKFTERISEILPQDEQVSNELLLEEEQDDMMMMLMKGKFSQRPTLNLQRALKSLILHSQL